MASKLETQSHPPNDEPRHCWICLQDEGEENGSSSKWQSPCPCALRAHEDCLIEWINDTDQKHDRSIEYALSGTHTMQCPQCKFPIQTERPYEPLATTIGLARLLSRSLVLPLGSTAIASVLWSASMVYGVNTLSTVFGAEETRNMMLFRDAFTNDNASSPLDLIERPIQLLQPFLLTWTSFPKTGTYFAIPMIAPALMLNRVKTAYRLTGIIPLSYFLFRSHHVRHLGHWPPSPAVVFALLPYFNSLYREFYDFCFGKLIKSWDAKLRRRGSQTDETVAVDRIELGIDEVDGDEDGAVVEVVIEVQNEGMFGGGMEEVERIVVVPEPPAPVVEIAANPPPTPADAPANSDVANANTNNNEEDDLPPLLNDDEADLRRAVAVPAEQILPDAAPDPVPAPPAQRLRANITDILVSATGALWFPSVASVAGDLLKYALPLSWVVVKGGGRPTGLLQQRWGRTVVGGILVVGLKDTLGLYWRWRRSVTAGRVRVLDFEGASK